MNKSILDAAGPVMIGPSSSHTAGAVRLGYVARKIAGRAGAYITQAQFVLHGSFADTGRGHRTHEALYAGVLGFGSENAPIADIFDKYGTCDEYLDQDNNTKIEPKYQNRELGSNYHENSVAITLFFSNGEKCEVVGSSIGGGDIVIRKIDGANVDMELHTGNVRLIMRWKDEKGFLGSVTTAIGDHDINIATARLGRNVEGGDACCIIEVDGRISDETLDDFRNIKNKVADACGTHKKVESVVLLSL